MKTSLLKTAFFAVLIAISTNVHAFTAVTSGAWTSAITWGGIAPGALVSNQDIIIPTGISVDLDIDAEFSGLLNNFTVDGTLNSSSNRSILISSGTFSGSGTVNIHRLSFTGLLTTASFTGTANVSVLRNDGAALTLASVFTVSDTLDLNGGSTILGTGSNINLANNASVRRDDGTLTTTGGVFTTTSSYDVWFYGTSKTTGLEVNSSNLGDVYIDLDDNTQVLTQGMNNLVVNGDFDLNAGEYALGANHLTLKGDYTQNVSAEVTTTATSDLTIMGSGAMTSNMLFSTGSSINDLEVDRANGEFKLGSDLAVAGTVYLTEGTFKLNAGTLTMNAGSSVQVDDGRFSQFGGSFNGTASYDVDYIGGSNTSDVELSGSGLNDVMVNLSSSSDTITLDDDVTINGNLDMSVGMLSLDGNDLTLDGTFDQNTSASFVGDSTSTMTLNLTSTNDTIWFAGSAHLDELDLNIPTTATILLASDLTIHNSIDMQSGRIEITNSSLHLRPAASINGYNEDRYIVTSGSGQVEIRVNSNSTYTTFPIGTMSNYSPAYIQQTSTGNSGMFKVRAMNGVFTQGTTGFNTATTESVVNKTWVIDAAAAVNVNMNLKLGWETANENNGFNRNQAHITHYMNNAWDTYATGSAVSGPNGTYEITRTGITSLSPFAVVDTAAALAVNNTPAITATINVYPNPTVDVVTVETSDLHVNYLYQIYDATGKMITSASNANAVNKFNLEAYSTGFYFIKITNTVTNATVTKRIVKN